jgi:hypothetical protein
MVAAKIDIFEMSYEESVAYFFKRLENLEKNHEDQLNRTLPVDRKKPVVSSVNRSKVSSLWCHYCEKNNHNTVDCRAMAKMKQQKKARFEVFGFSF